MTILKQVDFEVPVFGEFSMAPVSVPGYADAVRALSPLAYWRMDETSGTTLQDEIGSYPLSLTGSYLLAQEGALKTDSGQAVQFSDDANADASSPILPAGTNAPFSIAFWAQLPPGAIDFGPFMGQYVSPGVGNFRVNVLSDATLRATIFSTPNRLFTSTSQVTEGWRFIVLTRSAAGVLTWYFDAQLDQQLSASGQAIASNDFKIGNVIPTNPSKIVLDEIAVFDTELSPETVRWLYGLGIGRVAAPPSN